MLIMRDMSSLHMLTAFVVATTFLWRAQGIVTEMGSMLNVCGIAEPLLKDKSSCQIENYIAIYDVHNYTFEVQAGSEFSIQIQLSSLGFNGDADLYLYGPNGLAMSSSERIGNDVITIPPAVVSQTPGSYSVQVIGYQTYTWYKLGIQTPSRFPVLIEEEAKALGALFNACCDDGEDILAPVCERLKKASKLNRDPKDDMCSQPPNLCDAGSGRLTKLSLVGSDGGNLVCPLGFPKELSVFSDLVELDMSSNNMIGTLKSVADVIVELPYLRRLFLRRNSFNGSLECSLLNHKSLEVLWLGGNTLQGTLPACTFQSPQLEQLSLEGNMLEGPIPPFPAEGISSLMLVDLSNNKPNAGPTVGGTSGITGIIPTTVSSLAKLLLFDVSGNKLRGRIPDFPVTIQTLNFSDNALTGPLPTSISYSPNLRSLQASSNSLSGQIPALLGSAAALMSLKLNANSFDGGVQPYWQNQLLREFDISDNKLQYEMPYSLLVLPQLQVFSVGGNKMEGNLTRLGQNLKKASLVNNGENQIMVFNVSGNSLVGDTVPEDLMLMRLFRYVDPSSAHSTDVWDPVAPQVVSTFDISNTNLVVPFPQWLVPTLQNLYSLGESSLGATKIAVNGKSNKLTCPSSAPAATGSDFFVIEETYNLTCIKGDDSVSKISDAVGLTLASPPPPGGAPAPRGDDGGTSSIGMIVGVAAGVVALLGALFAGYWFWWRKRRAGGKGSKASRRTPLTFNSAYDPTAMSEAASGVELYSKEGDSNMMNAHANPVYQR